MGVNKRILFISVLLIILVSPASSTINIKDSSSLNVFTDIALDPGSSKNDITGVGILRSRYIEFNKTDLLKYYEDDADGDQKLDIGEVQTAINHWKNQNGYPPTTQDLQVLILYWSEGYNINNQIKMEAPVIGPTGKLVVPPGGLTSVTTIKINKGVKVKGDLNMNGNKITNTEGVKPKNPLKGDADGNGAINYNDTRHIQRYIVGLSSGCQSYPLQRCDINDDGTVNTGDVTLLQRELAGIEDLLPDSYEVWEQGLYGVRYSRGSPEKLKFSTNVRLQNGLTVSKEGINLKEKSSLPSCNSGKIIYYNGEFYGCDGNNNWDKLSQ